MLKPADQYFVQQAEPAKSCLLALRQIILSFNNSLVESLKYGMPFYCYHNKMFCYLWIHKLYGYPYIGIVNGNQLDHPLLRSEKRARMKILLVDPAKDIPVKTIRVIVRKAKAVNIPL